MFRLWLVLSCFWIVAVAAIGYSNWPSSTVQQATASKDDPKAYDPKTYVPEYMKDQNDPYEKYVNPNNA
jgi:hypothetical protein